MRKIELTGGGAGVGGGHFALLSRMDLSSDEVVKDAHHELRRCVSESDFGAWARKWGEAALREAANPSRGDDPDDDLLDDLSAAEGRAEDLSDAIRAANRAIDTALEASGCVKQDDADKIVAALEAALSE